MKKIIKLILITFLIMPIFSLRAEIYIPQMVCADGKGPWLADSLEGRSWSSANEAKKAGERYAQRIQESGGPSGCKVNDVFVRNSNGSFKPLSKMSANEKKDYSNRRNNYDGRQPLECNVNVNCSSQSEVVAKMTRRWAAFSKQTVYGRICLEAISRVKNIHEQVWDAGLAYNQIGVCNMQ